MALRSCFRPLTYSGGSAHSVSYGYEAAGNKTSMTDATGSSSYIYDPFSKLTSTTNGASQTIGYGYNPDGQVSSITYPPPSGATWATTSTVNYLHRRTRPRRASQPIHRRHYIPGHRQPRLRLRHRQREREPHGYVRLRCLGQSRKQRRAHRDNTLRLRGRVHRSQRTRRGVEIDVGWPLWLTMGHE